MIVRPDPAVSAAGVGTTATQEIGFAKGSGQVTNTRVVATNAMNQTVGLGSSATQLIGGAQGNGKLTNSSVYATSSVNTGAGVMSTAEQSIGDFAGRDAGLMPRLRTSEGTLIASGYRVMSTNIVGYELL